MARTVTVTLWDGANNAPKTGDAANITLYLKCDDGALDALDNSISEVDATDAPGEYSVTLTASEETAVDAAEFAKVVGKTSTADCYVIPVVLTGGVLKDVATMLSRLSAARATLLDELEHLDADVSSRSSHDDPDPSGYINKLDVPGTLANTDNADSFKGESGGSSDDSTPFYGES